MFQPIFRYLKNIGNSTHISARECKGLSDESIKCHAIFDNNLVASLNYNGVRPRIKFDGQSLKQDKVTFTHKNLVNVYSFFWQHINKMMILP